MQENTASNISQRAVTSVLVYIQCSFYIFILQGVSCQNRIHSPPNNKRSYTLLAVSKNRLPAASKLGKTDLSQPAFKAAL